MNLFILIFRDLGIYAYSSLTGEPLVHLRKCHMDDIQAVDSHQDVVVSGSRDATVKVSSFICSCFVDDKYDLSCWVQVFATQVILFEYMKI